MQVNLVRSIFVVILLTLLVGSGFYSPAQGTTLSAPQAQSEPTTVIFPIIFTSVTPSIFGVETWTLTPTKSIPMAAQANMKWMRSFVFDWDLIEATPGVYDWSSVNESGLAAASASGLSVIATIKFTPGWAQKVPPFTCGAIKQDAFDEFAAFVQELIRRYSGDPYNLKYIQFGNEPDVDPYALYGINPPDDNYKNIFGCWGDANDYYYGGGYYAKMLKVVYPAVKAVDPTVQVVIGGLLLAKDSNLPYLNEYDRRSGRFFEGILRNNGANNGANYFDIVAFHGYPAWSITHGLSTDENNDNWKHLGGIVVGKINFLRSVMAKIGAESGQTINKPIFQTEGALRCWDINCDDDPVNYLKFLQDQANYGVILFTRNLAHNLLGTMWYTIEAEGWNNSSLLFKDATPKPVYNSIKFLSEQLADSKFYAQITIPGYDSQQLQVYEFRQPDKRIWVLWVADLCWEDTSSPGYPDQTCEIDPEVEPPTITIPNGWTTVLDRDGNIIVLENDNLTLHDNRPYYIEFAPLPE